MSERIIDVRRGRVVTDLRTTANVVEIYVPAGHELVLRPAKSICGDPMQQTQHAGRISWKDIDDVRAELEWESGESPGDTTVARIALTDSATGYAASAFIDEQDARQIVAWLSERLRHV